MKKCTYCGKEFPDEAEACDLDGNSLNLINPVLKVAGENRNKKRLTHIAPFRAGIVAGVLYGALSFVFMLLTLTGFIFWHKAGANTLFGGYVLSLFMPVISGVLGFVGGFVGASVYNLLVKFTGGLEFEVRDVP